jgi:hypothetical protein
LPVADRGERVLTHRAEPRHAFSETVHRHHLTLGNMPFWNTSGDCSLYDEAPPDNRML